MFRFPKGAIGCFYGKRKKGRPEEAVEYLLITRTILWVRIYGLITKQILINIYC